MADFLTTTVGLWLAVVLSGLYHGLNPGGLAADGWPPRSLYSALAALESGHDAATQLMGRNPGLTFGVALLHTGAMLGISVHCWLGLRFLSQSWVDLENLWALSPIPVGAIGLWTA